MQTENKLIMTTHKVGDKIKIGGDNEFQIESINSVTGNYVLRNLSTKNVALFNYKNVQDGGYCLIQEDIDDAIAFLEKELNVNFSEHVNEAYNILTGKKKRIELEHGSYIFCCNDRSMDPRDYRLEKFYDLKENKFFVYSESLESYWHYCIPFEKFNPDNMSETFKEILKVENGRIQKIS